MTQPAPQWLWFVDDDLVHTFLALDPENPRLAKRASAHPALTAAVRSRLDGQPDRAIEQLRPAIEAGDEDALLLAGQIRFELCRFDEAAATFGLLAERQPANRVASFNQGLCLARLHKWPQAVDCLQKAAVRDPERMEVWLVLGVCLLNAKRTPGADACFKQALKLKPDYVPALVGRAVAFQLLGDHAGASAIYERLLEAQPDRVELLANAVGAASAAGDHERTRALANRLLELKPGHPAAGIALASSALARGDYPEAIRLSTELTRALPDSADNWFNLGLCHSRVGRHDAAVEALDRALEIDGANADAHEARARACLAAGRTGEAIRSWEAVVREAPDRIGAWFQMGRAHYESGEWQAAAAAFEQCTQRGVDYPAEAVVNLGLSRWKAGMREEARDALEFALVREAGCREAQAALVAIEIEAGDAAAAVRRYREFNARDPEMVYNLALLCHERGELKDAAQFYRKAIEFDPGLAEAKLNLGNVLFSTGDHTGAGRMWRAALDAKPELARAFMTAWS